MVVDASEVFVLGIGAQRERDGESERGSEHAEQPPRELQKGELRQMMPERKRDRREQKGDAESECGEYE